MNKRTTPQEQYLIILGRLATEGDLLTTDLVIPKLKFVRFGEQLPPKPDRKKYLPHGSFFDRAKELQKLKLIKSKNSLQKSKRGDFISEHIITFFGFVELFRLAHGKYSLELLQCIKDFLPLIGDNLDDMNKVFSFEQIFDTFTTVCRNTKIIPEYNALNQGLLPPYSVQRQSKWAHHYNIEIKIPLVSSTFIMWDHLFIYGNKKNEKQIEQETFKVTGLINKMMIFAFYHELMMRCQRDDADSYGYPTPDAMKFVMETFRQNKIIVTIYLNYLQKIKLKQTKESKIIKEIEVSLPKKRPLFKKSDLQ